MSWRIHFCALILFTTKPIIHTSSFSPLRLLNNGNSSQITNSLSIIKTIGEQRYIKNSIFKHWNIEMFIHSEYWLVHQAIASILTPFFHLGLPTQMETMFLKMYSYFIEICLYSRQQKEWSEQSKIWEISIMLKQYAGLQQYKCVHFSSLALYVFFTLM